MGRRRSNPLPRGVHERRYASGARSYWIDFRDQHGERVQEPAGTTVDGAVRRLEQRRGEVAAGTFVRGSATGAKTVATYADEWIELRRADGVRTVERERAMLRDHVLPTLGNERLADLRPRHIASLVRSLAGRIGPKSIRNVHGVLSAMLARARFDEVIVENVAKGLPKGVLPKNVRVRDVAPWTRSELEALIAPCEAIPEDRTVAYAIAAYTGARLGEIAGLRWRDLDVAARPLWRWALRTQYDGQPLKTDNPRDVPIHPELQRVLAVWKLDGWVRLMCWHPTADDFVLPRPAERAARRPQHVDVPHHTASSLGAKTLQRHARKLGIDPTARDFHSFRRSMITFARTDGAREDVLERVTHNAAGATIDGYTYFGWEPLCEAVGCLRLAPRTLAAVVELRSASRGDARGDAAGGMTAKASIFQPADMEPRGIEPRAEGGGRRIARDSRGDAGGRGPRVLREDPRGAGEIPGAVTRVTADDAIEALRAAGRDDLADAIAAALGPRRAP